LSATVTSPEIADDVTAIPLPRAVVFAEYFPPYMGSDRRIYDLMRHVRDWRVQFAVAPPLRVLGGRCEEALRDYFQQHFIDADQEDEAGGLHGHYFRLRHWIYAAWRVLPMPLAYVLTVAYLVKRASRHLAQVRPDIVVLAHPSYLCGLVGLIAARLHRVPVLLDYPDAWTPLAVETAGLRPDGLRAKLLGGLERLVARSCDTIVSISDGLTRYIRTLGSRARIEVVANGADVVHFDPERVVSRREALGFAPGDDVVLYSGRLELWSGIDALVETIERVVERRPRARFLFVGDGSTAVDFVAQLDARGLRERVVFAGFQRFKDMPALIAAADVAIVPFPSTPTTDVCVPVKLFEYLAMGVPVVTTGLPAIKEFVDVRHVRFVERLEASQLSALICDLLDDPQTRLELARDGAEHCRASFDYRRLAAQFGREMERVRTAVAV